MTSAQRLILANTQLTTSEKNAALLAQATAFRGHSHNFTTTPTPSKPIHTARGWLKTI